MLARLQDGQTEKVMVLDLRIDVFGIVTKPNGLELIQRQVYEVKEQDEGLELVSQAFLLSKEKTSIKEYTLVLYSEIGQKKTLKALGSNGRLSDLRY